MNKSNVLSNGHSGVWQSDRTLTREGYLRPGWTPLGSEIHTPNGWETIIGKRDGVGGRIFVTASGEWFIAHTPHCSLLLRKAQ
jgi:hypothetical protein